MPSDDGWPSKPAYLPAVVPPAAEIVSPGDLPCPAEAAAPTGQLQRGRPFQPGQSGNPTGRRKGSRNKLTEHMLATIADDFAEHGADTLATLRKSDPAAYFKIVASLIPRELVLQRERDPNYADMSPEELAEEFERAERNRKLKTVFDGVDRT
jgi:hypothetical protein